MKRALYIRVKHSDCCFYCEHSEIVLNVLGVWKEMDYVQYVRCTKLALLNLQLSTCPCLQAPFVCENYLFVTPSTRYPLKRIIPCSGMCPHGYTPWITSTCRQIILAINTFYGIVCTKKYQSSLPFEQWHGRLHTVTGLLYTTRYSTYNARTAV